MDRSRRLVQHAVPNDRKVQLSIGVRRLHECRCGFAGTIDGLVELHAEARRVGLAPVGFARARDKHVEIGRCRAALGVGQVCFHAVRTRLRRGQPDALRRLRRRQFLRTDVDVMDRFARRLGPLELFGHLQELAALQHELHAPVRARPSLRVNQDDLHFERLALLGDKIGLQPDQRVARERSERAAVRNAEIRNVGRLALHVEGHRKGQIVRNAYAHAARALRADDAVGLHHVGRDRRRLVGIRPRGAKGVRRPSLRGEVGLLARDVHMRPSAFDRCSEEIGALRPRGDGRAGASGLRIERQGYFEVRRLELGDAKAALERLACLTLRGDRVVAGGGSFADRQSDRERAIGVEGPRAERALLPIGIA